MMYDRQRVIGHRVNDPCKTHGVGTQSAPWLQAVFKFIETMENGLALIRMP